ncbi:hypothetical protein PAHAL_3G160300 [Panicum hallii]|uniref:Uncharacterized protein n=1 Tax=Panicum hallii TaxID=206008 RepID=A0A2T8KIG4_9POAL|nr:hypothetical protein PAHAL_3G160300 [Panicum hallii]
MGGPLPVLRGQRVWHMVDAPSIATRLEVDERGGATTPLNLEVSDRVVAVRVGVERHVLELPEGGHAVSSLGNAGGAVRRLAMVEVAHQNEMMSKMSAEEEGLGEVDTEELGADGDYVWATVGALRVGVGSAARGDDGNPRWQGNR